MSEPVTGSEGDPTYPSLPSSLSPFRVKARTSEGGLQWFNRLRAKYTYYGTTHLPGLDDLIRHCRPAQPDLRPGDCLSLYGRPGSGKSALLYYFALTTILPSAWSPCKGAPSVHLGGKGLPVVWIDMDGSFQPYRMASLIHHHFDRCISLASSTSISSNTPSDPIDLSELLQLSLDRLLIFRPSSSRQLLSLLSSTLPSLLLSLPHPPSLLLLDPVNLFDSIDAPLSAALDGAFDPLGLGRKASSSSSSKRASHNTFPTGPYHRPLAQAYRRLVRQWSPLVLLSLRWPFPEWEEQGSMGLHGSNGDSRAWKECMPSWLHGMETIRLWLSPLHAPAPSSPSPSPSPSPEANLSPPCLIQVQGKGSTRADCPKMIFEIAEDGLFDLTSSLLSS
ncbi:MAG: hypothetical protein DHS80DRAFT_22045 [Piptocephalis tieghemiana]|nr:MAG: hypothetical protein DHS80DRAFT_22045 [Piptocephalis tieghemiana]